MSLEFLKMSSIPTTNQETSSRGSYLSVAASITAKFKCCISMDTNDITEHNRAHNTNSQPTKEDSDEEIPIEEALDVVGELEKNAEVTRL